MSNVVVLIQEEEEKEKRRRLGVRGVSKGMSRNAVKNCAFWVNHARLNAISKEHRAVL